jgi:hypothetical protein
VPWPSWLIEQLARLEASNDKKAADGHEMKKEVSVTKLDGSKLFRAVGQPPG